MNKDLGTFLFGTFIVVGVSAGIENYSKSYAWNYAIIIILGVLLVYNEQITRFMNFGLSDKRSLRRGK